jgi:hypothetical protein
MRLQSRNAVIYNRLMKVLPYTSLVRRFIIAECRYGINELGV